MYNEGAQLELLGEWWTFRAFILWSLRVSWRVMYNEGAYLVVLEGLLEGDVQ